ncbi:unnamed protein product, partial [Laminaria digitata]
SVRLGNNRFGQPGAWQVSFFRDTIAPHSGVGGGGGYANNAIGTASSAPVFSTTSPAGTPRDLGILARSIKSAHQGSVEDKNNGNSTKEAVSNGNGGGGGGVAADAGVGMSRCHGVSLSTSWPFSFVRATLGAGYQQVLSPPTTVSSNGNGGGSGNSNGGSSSGGGGGSGALDVVTLSGGLLKHWRLPGVLQRLDRVGRRRGGGGGEMGGSVSSFLDVKTGCLLEGSVSPRPFTQELATLVHRVPVGPSGRADSWNVTLNVKQQVR